MVTKSKKIAVFLLFLTQASCNGQASSKINGVSFVASRNQVTQEHIKPVLELYANSAAVMPFGFVGGANEAEIVFNTEHQWFGETRAGATQYIQMLHKNGIAVMLKPQLWVRGGVFTGLLQMKSEPKWKALEKAYQAFILSFAEVAQTQHVEILCIGTELEAFVQNRPEFWKNLISEIKSVYTGKLTYAANWDEFDRVPFWGELDFIGVDAYFPLSESKTPTLKELHLGWKPWKDRMHKLASAHKKPILFTEFGYRSMNYTAKKPWLVDRTEEQSNMDAQSTAMQAVFDVFWKEKWFAGGYLWKWFTHHAGAGGINDNRFTPQNKPAELRIQQHFRKWKTKTN